MTDYANGTFHTMTSFRGKKGEMYASPEAVSWICNVDKNYHGKPDISCASRKQEAREQKRVPNELGISGLPCSVETAKKLYNRTKRSHGIMFNDKKRWGRLKEAVRRHQGEIEASPPMGPFWTSTLPGRTLRDKKRQFVLLFHTALRKGKKHVFSKKYRSAFPTFSLRWNDKEPEDIAAYDPNDKTLQIHTWAAKNFRRCDVIILALHEILGHHLQELNHDIRSSKEAESCGMRCEPIIEKVGWHSPGQTRPVSLVQCMHEWRLFRLVRAQVDLRLHSKEVKRLYPRSAHYLWYVHPSLLHICPAETETLRCASIPAQAQTYVQSILGADKKIKHCQC